MEAYEPLASKAHGYGDQFVNAGLRFQFWSGLHMNQPAVGKSL